MVSFSMARLGLVLPFLQCKSYYTYYHGSLLLIVPSTRTIAEAVAATTTPAKGTSSLTSSNTVKSKRLTSTHRTIQVHLIHRHGDRTPITPLANESFWNSTLPSSEIVQAISRGTELKRDDACPNMHKANGRGPFGKLTRLGVMQMIELGQRLKDDFVMSEEDETRSEKRMIKLFSSDSHLHPDRIKVVCTDFLRTIQSVQALLVGLLDNEDDDDNDNRPSIEIDARHTSLMIPDPQPRDTSEQIELETSLSKRSHMKEKEEMMMDLRVRMSRMIHPFLASDYHSVSFGISEENKDESTHTLLPWTQLSEISKCLQTHNLLLLPSSDQKLLSEHVAWKWFESLRHPRLSYLAMGSMADRILDSLMTRLEEYTTIGGEEREPWLYIHSGHDSTLIGLICVFDLEQPVVWPEYGSYIKIELIEVTEKEDDDAAAVDYFVRFSLNGRVLKCRLGDVSGSDDGMVRLETLVDVWKKWKEENDNHSASSGTKQEEL